MFNTSWDIVNVPLVCNGNLIQTSRYYKFMLWQVDELANYDVIVYCDAYLNPLASVDWRRTLKSLVINTLHVVMQSPHRFVKTVANELPYIVKANKATANDIQRISTYLQQNLHTNIHHIQLYENMVLAYNPKNQKYRALSEMFWLHYCNEHYGTIRDQPLWSVCLSLCNVKPECLIPCMLRCFQAHTKDYSQTHRLEIYQKNMIESC